MSAWDDFNKTFKNFQSVCILHNGSVVASVAVKWQPSNNIRLSLWYIGSAPCLVTVKGCGYDRVSEGVENAARKLEPPTRHGPDAVEVFNKFIAAVLPDTPQENSWTSRLHKAGFVVTQLV